MTPELQLVQQICQLTDSGMLGRSPQVEDLAEQFAELCHETNARLQRCSEYLDKGMRSEAVHEAQSQPALMELVAAIQFEGLRKWRNVCVDLDLAQPPPLADGVIERLKQECAREQDLTPLLREYRRCVYQGDRDSSIRVLRRLREKDPDNPSWPQNLRPLEEAQLGELLEITHEALEEKDLAQLRDLYEELNHSQRTVPAPADILAEVREHLLAERRQETAQVGERLSGQILAAAEQQDSHELDVLLDQWETLCADEAFRPDAAMDGRIEQARAWLSECRAQEAQREAFSQEVERTWDVLRGNPTAAEILQRRQMLADQPFDMPDNLARALEDALGRLAQRRLFRRRLLTMVTVLLLLALLGAALALWRVRESGARRERMLAHMRGLAASERYEELDDYLQAVSDREPEFYAAPEVRQVREDVDRSLALRVEKRRKFAAVMERLNRVRQDGYALAEEAVRRLVAEGADYAPDLESRATLDAWRQGYEDWRTRTAVRATRELDRIVLRVRRLFEQKQQTPFASLEAESRALADVLPLLAEGKAWLDVAAGETVSAYTAAAAQVDAWQRDLENRRKIRTEKEERWRDLRQRIARALPNLGLYESLVGELVNEFADAAEIADYRRVLESLPAVTGAVALQDLQIGSLPGRANLPTRLRELLENNPVIAGSVWEPDLKACLAYLDANAAVRARIPLLLADKAETLNLQVVRYRRKGAAEWTPLYCPKPLNSRSETDAQGNEFTLYWGQVYHVDQDTDRPWLTHSSRVFANHLNTREYDVLVQPRIQDNLVGHGKFLYGFVADAGDADQLDIHLLRGLQKLLADTELPLVPRAWLLKRLSHFLHESFNAAIPECREMIAVVERLNTEAPWMNPRHPEVVAAEAKIRDLLPAFPPIEPIIARLQAQRRGLAAALSRQLRCAGSLQPGAGRELLPQWVDAVPREAWIVTTDGPGLRPVFKRLVVNRDGQSLRPDGSTADELFSGQVLLAPGDGQDTPAVLDRVVPPDTGTKEQLQRPASWPVNAW